MSVTIRKFEQSDKEPVRNLLVHTKSFTDAEVDVAIELVDIFLDNPNQKDYDLYTAIEDNEVLGYICIGPTPLTEGTYDLYWIAVSPAAQGKGVGKQLIKYAEEIVKRNNGRLLVAETSSQPKYQKTRDFYVSAGYEIVSRIKEYYKVGDDLLVYGKYL